MKKEEIIEKTIDRGYTNLGTGIITNVKKTVFTVVFHSKTIKYDYPHAQFLEKVEPISKKSKFKKTIQGAMEYYESIEKYEDRLLIREEFESSFKTLR